MNSVALRYFWTIFHQCNFSQQKVLLNSQELLENNLFWQEGYLYLNKLLGPNRLGTITVVKIVAETFRHIREIKVGRIRNY